MKIVFLALITLFSVNAFSSGEICRDLFVFPKHIHSENLSWLKKDHPEIYRGVVRAIGISESEKFFSGWQPEDLSATEKKFDNFRYHIIEHLRDPNQTREIPRQYALDTFGNIGEAIALAEFRRHQPQNNIVVGDTSRLNSESGSRRRPDGISYLIDAKTNKILISGILESKISKTSSSGFNREQYQVMLLEWQTLGLQISDQDFEPSQIEIAFGDKKLSITETSFDDFMKILFVYQPSAFNLSVDQRSALGIQNLLPVTVEPWRMRFVGFSIIAEAMRPYIEDQFSQYQKDMVEIVRIYRSREDRKKAIDLLGKYDVEFLNAGIFTLAPDLLAQIKNDQTLYAPRPIHVTSKKSALYAENDFKAWKSGRLKINDPVELAQLRAHFDSQAVFGEFLIKYKRWPERIDLIHAQVSEAPGVIIEDRFQSEVKRLGGPEIYFLTALPRARAKEFLLVSGWRPKREDLIRCLNQKNLNLKRSKAYLEQVLAAFGPGGWGLEKNELPIFDSINL